MEVHTLPIRKSGETILESCSCNLEMTGAGTAIGYANFVESTVKILLAQVINVFTIY